MQTVTIAIHAALYIILATATVARTEEKAVSVLTALSSTTISGGNSSLIPFADPVVVPVPGDAGIAGAFPGLGGAQFAPNPFGGFGPENNLATVPEPSTFALLALGALLVAWRGRKFKSAVKFHL